MIIYHRFLLLAVLCLNFVPGTMALGKQLISGDVYIQVVASIYRQHHQQNSTCSAIDAESVKNIEAIRWILEKINTAYSQSQNFRIGMNVIETCASTVLTEKVALDLAIELKNNATIFGVIGVDSSSETEVLSRLLSALPSQYRVPQISYSATSVTLRNRDIYRNLFRVIPSDDIQVKAMLKFLEQLKWNYISIIYEDNEYGRGGLHTIRSMIAKRRQGQHICIPVEIAIPPGNYGNVFTELRDKIFQASPPQQGIIVFGISSLMTSILQNTELLLNTTGQDTRPVFLFSETGSFLNSTSFKTSKGAFVTSPHFEPISEYESWFVTNLFNLQTQSPNVNNFWQREAYEAITSMDLNSSPPPQLTSSAIERMSMPSVYSHYAIQAALVMVKAYFDRKAQLCGSPAPLCEALLNDSKHKLTDVLNTITVNFDRDFRLFTIEEFTKPDLAVSFDNTIEVTIPSEQTQYEIYNAQNCPTDMLKNCLVPVGYYSSADVLSLETGTIRDYNETGEEVVWPYIRKAQCPVGHVCEFCISSQDATLFIPGDMYVVGIVPVHNEGDTPLQCGRIKLGGLDILESIRFTVDDLVSELSNKIPSGKIGVIIIDSCNDPQVVQEKVLTLNRLGVLVDGEYVSVRDKILGYIGGWSSDSTKGIAEITTRLKYPQISYASTATFLSKRTLYPYLLRVTSNDKVQAGTIIDIIDKYIGANMFQVIYSESTYGEGGRAELQRLAADRKLCIVNEIPITRLTRASTLVESLRNFSDAKIVVVFGGSFHLEYIVEDMNNELNKREFLFITSDGWGTRFHATGLDKFVGSITLSARLGINNKFKTHVKNLSPETEAYNFWLTEYMETQFGCYYEWSYNKSAVQQCTGNESLGQQGNNYVIDEWAPFAERATIALLDGSKWAIDKFCNGIVCPALRDNVRNITDYLTTVEILTERFPERIFDDNGDGREGFQIFVLDSQYRYQQILAGDFLTQFQNKGGLIMNSTCGRQSYCLRCFVGPPLKSEGDSLSGGIIAVIIILGVVCCVLVGILLFVCNRHGCCIKMENGRPKLVSTYLTPVYDREPRQQDDPNMYNYLQENAMMAGSGGNTSTMSRQDRPSDSNGSGSVGGSGSHGSYGSQGSYPSGNQIRGLPTPVVQMNQGGSVLYNPDGSYITATSHNQSLAPPIVHTSTDSGLSGSRETSTGSSAHSGSSGYIAPLSEKAETSLQ